MSSNVATGTRSVKVPGPDHPITIVPNPSRVVVTLAGQVIADTRDAWTLREGNDVQILEKVEGGVGLISKPAGMQAQLSFRIATSPTKPLVRMRIVRDRTGKEKLVDVDAR